MVDELEEAEIFTGFDDLDFGFWVFEVDHRNSGEQSSAFTGFDGSKMVEHELRLNNHD